MNKFVRKYGNIYSFATLQFDGHYLQYLIENTHKLVALYLLPRGGGVRNFFEVYSDGRCIERHDLISPKQIILTYIYYYYYYVVILFKYFGRKDKVYIINFLPFFFFFNLTLRTFRNIEFVYWIGDYWPMNTFLAKIQRVLMHFYHDRTKYCLYLSDRINIKMNYGHLMQTSFKKTSMWGIKPPKIQKNKPIRRPVTLCFIGVIVEWQQIDLLLSVIAKNPNIRLKLIGTGDFKLISQYKNLINVYGIASRVYFPNRFMYGEELKKTIVNSHIGIALYKSSKDSVTYYADPAKIKQYAEFGLPIIMTNSADIASYIQKFKAGIIVNHNVENILQAISKISNNYPEYLTGLDKFNQYFNFRPYYRQIFQFLEK